VACDRALSVARRATSAPPRKRGEEALRKRGVVFRVVLNCNLIKTQREVIMSKARVKLRAKGNAAKKSALREKQKKSSDALQLNMDDEEYQNFVVSTSLKLNLTEVEVEEAVK